MSHLHHALVFCLCRYYHLSLAFQINFHILHTVAKSGRSGSFSLRLLTQLIKGRIEHHAHLLFVVYITDLSPDFVDSMILRTVVNLAVPKLYLLVRDQSQRFFVGSCCLLGHLTIKFLDLTNSILSITTGDDRIIKNDILIM